MTRPVRPPRGFRDFPPEIMLLRKDLFQRLEKVFQLYGFDPIDTPALEYWEVLAGKYGEEAESRLIWRFKDPWSGREYALRYDLTVPLARFMATHKGLPLPFKRYHIGPVWRHEEPQKGRYREFYQCDADIVGSPYPEADAEIVNLTIDSLKALGFESGFTVRLNDRRLLRGVFEEELGLTNVLPVYRAIDKLDKIGIEGVRGELEKIGLSDNIINKIIDIISLSGEPEEILQWIRGKYGGNENVKNAAAHLEEMIPLIKRPETVKLDLSLVRGLDYYTGPILEVVLDKPRIGSVAGGGRYDDLIGLFLGERVPATGVSIGIERIIDAGLELGIYTLEKKTVTLVQVIVLDKSREVYSYAWQAANLLRDNGIPTRINLARTGHRVQRRKAQRLGIPVLAFAGKKEAESGSLTLYHTGCGKRLVVGLDEAAKSIELLIEECGRNS
ncbi:MAG: histidine--tRNA ligase [Desulfurococcales archaeon]|nr:histidine--tRNA ligase [Desulfurococcales archaeon]